MSVSASLPAPLGVEMLTVTVRDRDHLWRWRPTDFTAGPPGRTPTIPERRTSITGTLAVSFAVDGLGSAGQRGTSDPAVDPFACASVPRAATCGTVRQEVRTAHITYRLLSPAGSRPQPPDHT
jgi:hypothetical protein